MLQQAVYQRLAALLTTCRQPLSTLLQGQAGQQENVQPEEPFSWQGAKQAAEAGFHLLLASPQPQQQQASSLVHCSTKLPCSALPVAGAGNLMDSLQQAKRW